MQIQIMTKNEPFQPCGVLIAKEGLMVQVPVESLEHALDTKLQVHIVKAAENMSMKCAILIDRLASRISDTEPVFIACSDKTILDAVCSLELHDAEGRILACMPAGSKPGAKTPAKSARSKSSGAGKNKTPRQPGGTEDPGSPGEPGAGDSGSGTDTGTDGQDGKAPDDPDAGKTPSADDRGPNQPEDGSETGQPSGVYDENLGIKLPGVSPGSHEIDLASPPEPEAQKPGESPAAQVMKTLKDLGIPSNQIPGVLEAVREAADASITLPMQVRLKLARDKATDGLTPEDIAGKIAPEFDKLQALMKAAQAQ